MTKDLEAWLALTREQPIEPNLPICDPHHHMFGRTGEYHERPDELYLPEDLMSDIDGNNVVQTVFVECRTMYRKGSPEAVQPVGEMEFVRKIADRSDAGEFGKTRIAAGIMGYADLTLGDKAAPVIEDLMATAGNHFRGLRHVPVGKNHLMDRECYSNTRFRQGFALLKKYNLVFDSWQHFYMLKELASLARDFPDVPIIVGHTAGLSFTGEYAGKRQQVTAEWKEGITELSACPSVVMKLGGMGMPRAGFDWANREKPPGSTEVARGLDIYFTPCVELFGVKRCMFESNFPVDRLAYPYTVMWNAFKLFAKNYTKSEKAALFHDTAARVYRLGSKQVRRN